MLTNVFFQISLLLGVTVAIAFIGKLLRQPLIVAYLIAGMLAPLFLTSFQPATDFFDTLAKFGVIFLLFMVGLSLNFSHLRHIGPTAIGIALTQILATALVAYFLLSLFSISGITAFYIALALTFSSTIIVVKLLSEKKDLDALYGRYTVTLMVVQDLAALTMLIVIGSLNRGLSLDNALVEMIVKASFVFGIIYLLAKSVIPHLLRFVASSGEFLFIFAIAWCFAIAGILFRFGFSLEVGALVAGLALGSSPFQTEIASRVKPLRDFFLILFFIILGSSINLYHLPSVLAPAVILSLFVMIIRPFILYHIYRLFHFARRNSFLGAITAAQISEFGFVLLFAGKQMGVIDNSQFEIFTATALITIMLSSYLITYNKKLYQWLSPVLRSFGRDRHSQKETITADCAAWIFGYHRMGWKISDALLRKEIPFAIVDCDPVTVAHIQKTNTAPVYFGDAADVEFLSELPLEKSKLIISTLPDLHDQKTLLRHVRSHGNQPLIIVTAYDVNHINELYDDGANYVLMPQFLGGNWLDGILRYQPWTKETFAELQKEQQEELASRVEV